MAPSSLATDLGVAPVESAPGDESVPMSAPCLHSWEPIPLWRGRYRCKNCGSGGFASGCGIKAYVDGRLPWETPIKHHANVSCTRRVSELPDPKGWVRS